MQKVNTWTNALEHISKTLSNLQCMKIDEMKQGFEGIYPLIRWSYHC